jgi:hypothetical protein
MFREWLENHLPESVLAAMFAIVGWWIQRKIARSEALEARIAALEKDGAKRGDIEALREHIDTSITRAVARVETRTDEILLHLARQSDR